MALPPTAANAAQVESGARTSAQPASPLSCGVPTYSSVPQSSRPVPSSQQQSSSLPRQSLDLGVSQQSGPNSVNEGGKEATTHDFLSLHGSGSASSTQTTASRELTSSVTTQDFLHPLEKAAKPSTGSLFSQGLVTVGANRPHVSSADFVSPQQTSFALVNGTLELPSSVLYRADRGEAVNEGMKERLESLAQWSSMPMKFRPSDTSYAPKSHVPQAVPLLNKQWQQQQQQQQQQLGSDFFDVNKRTPRVPSEDDDDDDNEESIDRGQFPKKEMIHQKCDTSQKLEGKSNDYRGNTPRSKHSATEQRRRSKINDRFQMLRQLVPNSDQKRDKASFLLEVIGYIQMLQEKLRKYEAAEHTRQQETAKAVPWDVFQRKPGCSDSPTNASRMPSVTNMPFDSKQGTDLNGYVRHKSNGLSSACDIEVSGTEFMQSTATVSAVSDRHMQVSQAHHSNFENKSTICKPVATTLPGHPAAFTTFGSCSNDVFFSVPQTTAESRAVFSQLHYQEEQPVSPCSEAKSSLYNKVEAANNLVSPQSINNMIELDHEKAKVPEQKMHTIIHRKSDEEVKQMKPSQGQHLSGSFSREGERADSSAATGIDDCKSKPKVNIQADEQEHEPLIIQGGVINVSSVYSQGLLDTLTRALQSSGLDLSQAMISVQIDLGNSSGTVVASSRKTTPVSAELSPWPNGVSGASLESERPSKKPKIEVDS